MKTLEKPTSEVATHTPGPWRFKKYVFDEKTREDMRKHGIDGDGLALSNDGQAAVMSDNGRIAAVDCKTEFKRGKGHLTECPERDANARLIAAAPDYHYWVARLLAELPERRDWLDPEIERGLRDARAKAETE